LFRSALIATLALPLFACTGNDTATDDDTVAGAGLDRCADGTAPLGQLWSVDNLHGEIVSMSPVAPDGTIVLGTADGAVKQWALGTSADVAPLSGGRPSYGEPFTESGMPARALAIGVDGDRVLAGDDGVGVRAWSIPDAAEVGSTQLKGAPLTAIAPRSGTEVIVADTAFGGEMRGVDLDGGTGTGVFTTVLWNVTALATGGDDLFDVGADYGMAAIERRDLADPTAAADAWVGLDLVGSIRSVAVSADGAWVATGGDGHLLLFAADDLAAGPSAQLALTTISARGVAFTASGARVAVVTDDGHAALYGRDLVSPVATVEVPQPIGAAVDPSGTRLIVASADGQLRAFGCTP